jgi:hypothetical protein
MEQQAQASGHGWGAQETQEYLSRFRRARESFLYQRVYDPARLGLGLGLGLGLRLLELGLASSTSGSMTPPG